MRKFEPVSLENVAITDAFWSPRIAINRSMTIPSVYHKLKEYGQIDALKPDLKVAHPRVYYWDSDVTKWIEACAYSLAVCPDKKLGKKVDQVINLFAKAQQEDGYLNSYFIAVEPQNRLTNLCHQHELYCAGHLTEAAVAYFRSTGKKKFLEVACRFADFIDSVFGPGKEKKQGYPGHPELELALVKLFRLTGRERYLRLAKFFIDERGRQPHYFEIEAEKRGEDAKAIRGTLDTYQAHLPVRKQKSVEGHAVRAMYLLSGMADVAAETKDAALLASCRRLWKNVVQKRMYITGGIGSSRFGERFTFDYDLPNETAYAETCAAIALVFFAHRMLQLEADSQYADVMERALYNGVLSGVSQDGKRFFYANPLSVFPEAFKGNTGHVSPVRQTWFGCACCPTNMVRLLSSIGQYIYSQNKDEAYVHLYVGGTAQFSIGGQCVELVQQTEYPWKETIRILVKPEKTSQFTLALRIPGWCRRPRLRINGKAVKLEPIMNKGYAKIRRIWSKGDVVDLTLPMPVERMEASPSVRMNCGRVALQRGPVVYCLEQVDNGKNLNDITLLRHAPAKVVFSKKMLGKVPVITTQGERRDTSEWRDSLYRIATGRTKKIQVKATPYFLWNNRGAGEMLVWIRSA